jgi:AcrR family transcriptional regulator
MARQTERPAPSRAPLTKDRVLRAAVALADESGAESLTMRTLGRALGVEAMSLYNHVENKDDILDGMVDVVYGEIDLPLHEADWKTALRRQAISAREALSRHRWAIGLMEARVRPGPANLRHHDSVIRILRQAGFSIEMAMHAFSVLNSYVYGFALQDLTLPFDTHAELVEVAETILQQFPFDQYPNLGEVIGNYVARSDYRFAEEFEFGLDLILEGLERLRSAT